MTKQLGWFGAALGIAGAILLSLNIAISGWGYLFFTGSSISLSTWAILERQRHQLVMQLVFTVIKWVHPMAFLIIQEPLEFF